MQEKFKILFHVKENGNVPFLEFYNMQDSKMKARIDRLLYLLQEKGNKILYPSSEKLDKNIFELRIKQGSNHCRVLYFFYVDKQIVVTNGFVKKFNKVPRNELIRANNYRIDWIRRNEG